MSKWTERWDLQQCWFANKVLRYHWQERFISRVTHAERGMGKSMLDLQTMAYIYYHFIEKDEQKAWQYGLDNMLFLPSQLEQRIDYNEEHDKRDLVWCLDDAAVHFGNKLWWVDQAEAILLEGTFDLIRPVVTALLINCTQKERLMSSLQHYNDYDTSIYIPDGGHERDRKTVTIHWYSLPNGARRYDKVDEEYYSVMIPTDVYQQYREKRKKYIKIIRDKMRAYRDRKYIVIDEENI